jgi:hypothetical protein
MPNNKPLRDYSALRYLVSRLLVGVTGWKAWLGSIVLNWLFRWLAKEGVYFIDISGVYIATNMQEKEWLKVNSESWEKVEKGGLSEEEGREIDKKFIKAFDDFAVFKRVRNG